MVCIAMVLCGLAFFVHSIAVLHGLDAKVKKEKMDGFSPFALTLVYLFALGYAAFAIHLFLILPAHGPVEFLISTIFFFGAVFVAIVTRTDRRLISALIDRSARLEKKSIDLGHRAEELEISGERQKRRSEELKSEMEEVKRFNKEAVGRELRMIELKNRISELEEELRRLQ